MREKPNGYPANSSHLHLKGETYWKAKYEDLAKEIHLLYSHVTSNQRKTMDPLSEIAAISSAIDTLKAGSGSTTPTTNFVTPDVQSALDAVATKLGVVTVNPTPTS